MFVFPKKNKIKQANINKENIFKFFLIGLTRCLILLLRILIQYEKPLLCSFFKPKLFRKTLI